MYPQEYETLTYDLCNKFREHLRSLIVDIQDICYSYREEKNRDLSFWISTSKEIDSTIRSFLYIEKFKDYRDPIESFKDKFDKFKDNMNKNQKSLLTDIRTQLNEIGDSSDIRNLVSNTIFEDTKIWSEIEKKVQRMKNTKEITMELYQKLFNSIIRGKAIAHIYFLLKEINDFYSSMPKVMTLEDQKIYVLQRENDKLTKQNRVKDTQIRQLQTEKQRMQSKLDSEIKSHKDDLVKADVRFTSQTNIEKDLKVKVEKLEDELRKCIYHIKELEDTIKIKDEIIRKSDEKNEKDDFDFREILSMCSLQDLINC